MASRAVTRPEDFFLMNIELRRKARRISNCSRGGKRRRLAYFVRCLLVSLAMAAAMSEAGWVRDARAMDISVRRAGTGSGIIVVGWLFKEEGCWALKERLRWAAERAL